MNIRSVGTAFTVLALALLWAACDRNPVEPITEDPEAQPFGKAVTIVETHPAILCCPTVFTGRGSLSSVAVEDSTGKNSTTIYQATSTSDGCSSATWSPSGGSASFILAPKYDGVGTYAIKAIDIKKTTKGLAAGSGLRTICSYTASTNRKIRGQAWCPVASMNKIAFIGYETGEWGVYTVPATGGTATKIYGVSESAGELSGAISWSADGTQLAFVQRTIVSGGSTYAIKIIGASGGVNATLLDGAFAEIQWVTWAHGGLNELAICARQLGVKDATDIYKMSAYSGATPVLLLAGTTVETDTSYMYTMFSRPVWSPNNSQILCGAGIWKRVNTFVSAMYGATKLDIAANTRTGFSVYYGDWRDPIW